MLSQVFNYPYDTSINHPQAQKHENEDAPAFIKMAEDFVKIHPQIAKQT